MEMSAGEAADVSEETTIGEMGATMTVDGRKVAEGLDGKYVCRSLEMASAAIFSSEATCTNVS
jgi:hypothetical protein